MQFGHVVYSDGAGNVTDDRQATAVAPMANEVVYQVLDDDGQCINDDVEDLYKGWTLLRGWTGQYGYNGVTMHPSEFIGGRLERHIRENAGYYVAVVVDGMYNDGRDDDDDRNIGWAIAYSDNTSESE